MTKIDELNVLGMKWQKEFTYRGFSVYYADHILKKMVAYDNPDLYSILNTKDFISAAKLLLFNFAEDLKSYLQDLDLLAEPYLLLAIKRDVEVDDGSKRSLLFMLPVSISYLTFGPNATRFKPDIIQKQNDFYDFYLSLDDPPVVTLSGNRLQGDVAEFNALLDQFGLGSTSNKEGKALFCELVKSGTFNKDFAMLFVTMYFTFLYQDKVSAKLASRSNGTDPYVLDLTSKLGVLQLSKEKFKELDAFCRAADRSTH